MSSTLSEGVRVPDIGSVNWGADVNFNWGLLNTALANISGNVKTDVANTWTATQTFSETISGSIDGVAARAVGDEDGNNIKSALAGKQSSLSQSQLDACNSGITAAAVQQIGTNASNISGLQTAVASKAADNTVVHLAGAETITGNKTWTGLNTYQITLVLKDAAAVSAGGYGVGLGFFDYAGTRYGYIQPHVTSDGTKNIVFGNSASGYLEFTSSLVPYASGAVNLGLSTNQWGSVYAQIYYYKGTQWGLDTSNVWTGSNKFVSPNTNFGFKSTTAEAGSSTASSNWIYWQDKNDYQDAYISRDIWGDGSDGLRIAITSKRSNGAPSTTGTAVDCGLRLNIHANGSTSITSFDNGGTDLGTSTNKWKTLNGVNPGALSIPNLSANSRVDISASIVADSYGNIKFTPQIYGWVYIDFNVTSATITSGTVMYAQAKNNNLANTGFAINFMRIANSNHIFVWMPVWENKQIIIEVNFSGFSVGKAYIYPCLGNV